MKKGLWWIIIVLVVVGIIGFLILNERNEAEDISDDDDGRWCSTTPDGSEYCVEYPGECVIVSDCDITCENCKEGPRCVATSIGGADKIMLCKECLFDKDCKEGFECDFRECVIDPTYDPTSSVIERCSTTPDGSEYCTKYPGECVLGSDCDIACENCKEGPLCVFTGLGDETTMRCRECLFDKDCKEGYECDDMECVLDPTYDPDYQAEERCSTDIRGNEVCTEYPGECVTIADCSDTCEGCEDGQHCVATQEGFGSEIVLLCKNCILDKHCLEGYVCSDDDECVLA